MAPTEPRVEWQTSLIVKYLLEDEDEVARRDLCDGVETDGPEDDFDPVLIAEKLKQVADSLNDDPKFKSALNELKEAAAKEAAEKAFSEGVEALCRTQVSQRPEVAPEMQIIRASVAIGLYIKKNSPDLKKKVGNAMHAFLTRRVGPWITQQGGWDKLNMN